MALADEYPEPRKPTGCFSMLLLTAAAFILFVIAGIFFSSRITQAYGSSLPDPAESTATARKIREVLQRERAARQQAVQESIERIRQTH